MATAEFGFFKFARHEMSHSAFWAWVLNTVNSPAEAVAGPRRVGRRLLAECGCERLANQPFRVDVEVPVPGATHGRLDVLVKEDVEPEGKPLLAIENKVEATPDPEQIRSYRESLGEEVPVVLMSTTFDTEPGGFDCAVLDAKRIRGLVEPERATHPLLGDYFAWLDGELVKREGLEIRALGDGPYWEALREPEGQWTLMKAIRESLQQGQQGLMYRKKEASGNWTECCFTTYNHAYDHLLYRIEEPTRTGGALALRQVQPKPWPTPRAKHERLVMLRRLWAEARQSSDCSLHFSDVPLPHEGLHSAVIALMPWARNPVEQILREFCGVHSAFVTSIQEAGWVIGAERPDKLRG